MKKVKWTGAFAALTAMMLVTSACGLGGERDDSSNAPEAGSVDPDALKGVSLIVGSKDFDEQLLLGQITISMLSAAGADVEDKTNIQGSTATRNALKAGKIDVYWDYTGTAWVTYLGHDDPIADETKQFEAVRDEDAKDNDLVWANPAPFNNTYAFATTEKFAEENNLESLSDMADYVGKNDTTVCVESEFETRPDGLPGVIKTYGMDLPAKKIKKLGTGVIYTQLDKGTCDFGEVFTTDGRIATLNLKPLEDDKTFFPLYNGAVVLRADTNEEHPEVLEVLEPLSDILTTEKMAELNAKVSSDGIDPKKVAEDFLKEEGFIK